MRRYVRRKRLLRAAALAVVCVAGFTLAVVTVGVRQARASGAELEVMYTSPNAIQVEVNGAAISSGTTIPAGSYMVIVYDANVDTNPQFTISGPGVSVSSNLDSTGMGIDQTASFGPYTLQTSSSYTVEDTNIGASSLVTFQTSATANASGGTNTSAAPSTTSKGGQSTSAMTTHPQTTTSSHANSPPSPGRLLGSVSATGKLTVTFDGRHVSTLKAGRYTVALEGRIKGAELILGRGGTTRITIGATATAAHPRTVTLSTGSWFFEPRPGGPKTPFRVVT